MTTKVPHAPHRTGEAVASSTEDLRAAYQAHTLVQMMYGQMALAHPWEVSQQYSLGPLSSYEPPLMSEATPWAAAERCGFAWTIPTWFR